jgi:hypothetical protein
MLANGMRKDAALRAAVAAAMAVCLLPCAVARAGTYEVVACNAPGAGGANRSWTVEPYNAGGKAAPPASAFVIPAETCNAALRSDPSRKTVKADDGAAWTFRAPAGTLVKSVQLSRAASARQSVDDAATTAGEGNSWTVIARGSGATTLGDLCPGASFAFPAYCQLPAGGVSFNDVAQAVVAWGIQCTGVTAALCFTGDGAASNATATFTGARVTVEDTVAPDVGTDAGASWRRSGDPVTAVAADSAGVKSLRVLVDGAERASRTFDCDFRLAAPCPTPGAVALDLAGIADGRHLLTSLAQDTAGNVSKSEQAVDVDGTAPAVDLLPVSGRAIRATAADAASGLRAARIEYRASRSKPWAALKTTLRGARMSATLPKGRSATRVGIRLVASDNAGNEVAQVATSMSLAVHVGKRASKVRAGRAAIGYGRDATLTGRLTATDGAALPNQPLVVTSRLRRTGSVPQPFTSVTTDASGRFSIPVPAGPGRDLAVSYPGTAALLHRVREVSLRVPASSTIRADDLLVSGAAAVRFSGRLRLLGASLPAGGKLVDLQAAQHGRWTTVATTRATSSGWHAVARFRGTPGRYPVRLRIRREAAFPYDLGYSPSVAVRVR